ncbi:MAG: putative membrane protein YphA (DoxX/SURF4 family) [Crocinitomicaceae bacterium]|jgi:uncharacterized membrane protein YphA (DoxX/SURF4 family)
MGRIKFNEKRLLLSSIGFIYIYFGILKFFPDLSPAEEIAKETIDMLSLGVIPPNVSIILLAIFEVGLGLFILLGVYRKLVISAAIFHMLLTLTPLFVFPEHTFNDTIFSPTLLGQYIAKNFVIICALLVVYPKIKKEELVIDQLP